jgi:hypothetical protein
MARTKGQAKKPELGKGKERVHARIPKGGGKGKGGGKAAATGKQASMEFDRDEVGRLSMTSQARLSVWSWWMEIYKAMLKMMGYRRLSVIEAEGDCMFVAFLVTVPESGVDEQEAKGLLNAQRATLITKGCRLAAVDFLAAGKAPEACRPSGEDLHRTALAFGIKSDSPRIREKAMRKRLAPWLNAYHYTGAGGYGVLAANCSLRNRVSGSVSNGLDPLAPPFPYLRAFAR